MNFNHDTGFIDSLLTIDTTVAPPLGGATGSLSITGTGALVLPAGTTGQRTANAIAQLRYNTDNSNLEYNNGSTWVALSTGGGTVSSVAVTGSTGLSVSGSPITTSGTITLTLDTGLSSLASLATTGIIVQSAADTFISRSIAVTNTARLTVTNGDGVSGNPTLDLATLADGGTGTFLKITRDTYGRVSGTTAVVAGDITTLVDTTYVNVSGDTMSGALAMGGNKITGLGTPTAGTDAVTKDYVDTIAQGLDPKNSVRAATTANGTLASSFANGQVIDGYTLVTGDRILIKNQSTASQNGVYTVNATGAPTRAVDMSTWAEVPGSFVWVEQGTVNADTGWVCTSDQGGTIDTTSITWSQFGGVGTYTAGTGLTLTGTQFSLTTPVTIANGGTGLSATPTNGQIDIGNGTNFTRTTLTQGTAITITNGAGSITIANAGVTSIAGTSNQITASGSTGAVTLSLPSAVTLPGSLTVTTSATISGLTANSFLYSGTAGLLTTTTAPTNGQLLIGSTGAAPVAAALTQGTGITVTNGAGSITIANAGVTSVTAGTGISVSGSTGSVTISNTGVTSVAVSGGTTGLTVSGSPITTTGTITLAGTLVTANGGTGLTSIGSANQILGVNTGATALEYKTVTAGTGISVTPAAGSLTIANTGVTSVALSLPSIFTVSGSPVTTTGTLTGTLANQTTNTVFAAPNGSTGAPTFRLLAYADLPIKLYGENASGQTAPSATGTNAVAIGSGSAASATGAVGVGDGSSARIFGMMANANGKFVTAGDAQQGFYVLRNITTTATATELFLDGTTATQRLVLPNNSVFTFSILVSARRTDATGGGAGYKFEGVARKDTTAGSLAFVGSPSKSILGETNTAWDAALSVDTTNGSLKVTVTGEAAKTIRWVATIITSEVTN